MADTEAYRIRPFLAEFRDRQTEEAFRTYICDRRVRDTRLAIMLAAVFFLAFVPADIALLSGSDDLPTVLATRVGICVYGLTAALLARRYWYWLTNGTIPSLVIGVAMLAWLFLAPLLPYHVGWHGMGLMTMLLGNYVFIPNRFLHALVIAILVSLGYFWLVVPPAHLNPNEMPALVAMIVIINILGAMACHRHSRMQHEEFRHVTLLKASNDSLRQEVRERQRLEAKLRDRIDRDSLTGTVSRAHFFEQAPQMLITAAADGTPLSLLLLDVDYFRQINGTYGQVRGDEVLQSLADVCRQQLGAQGLLARIGGEEFVVLLPDTGQERARELGERLRAEIQRTPLLMPDTALFFTVSVGVTQWRPGDSLNALLYRADNALSTAKYQGRNRVAVA